MKDWIEDLMKKYDEESEQSNQPSENSEDKPKQEKKKHSTN